MEQQDDETNEDSLILDRCDIKELLTDVGSFSLASLCAIVLSELYDDEINSDFKYSFVEKLVPYLGLPKEVINAMNGFLSNENPECLDSLIPAIMKEKSINGDGSLLVQELIFFAIQDGVYDARARVLIYNIATFLRVSPDKIEVFEENAIEYLSRAANDVPDCDLQEMARRARKKKIRRRILIAAAAIGGGALIGLSGGLAVPLIAAGAGAVIGGAGAAAIGSVAGIAIIGSLFGVAGAGLTGFKMKKRVGNVEEFAFEDLTEGNELFITVAISGWLPDDCPGCFRVPWENLYLSKEQYCLRYESKYLLELGKAIEYFASSAVSMAVTQTLQTTAIGGLLTAIAWPAILIQLSSIIDNPWYVCMGRSAEVGKVLAETLLTRQQGKRPVSLLGYSLGARVIFYCLKEMTTHKGYQGIIEDVVLLGAPVSADVEEWTDFDKVVSGKIVNGYSSDDWLLKFLYRTSKATLNIAGLQPVPLKSRRLINTDLSSCISSHFDYSKKICEILNLLGIRTRKSVWKQESMVRLSKKTLNSVRPKRNANHTNVNQIFRPEPQTDDDKKIVESTELDLSQET